MDLVELITLASIEDELSGYGSIFFWGGGAGRVVGTIRPRNLG